jgi:pyruvate,orthophosphate dikinase
MTYGMSRDDAGPFLMPYIAKEIYKEDPTVSIDVSGVGRLMQICVDDARKVNPNIKLGICGEQGGDPDSVKFARSWASPTFRVRPSACRSRVWRRRKLRLTLRQNNASSTKEKRRTLTSAPLFVWQSLQWNINFLL